jgi:hypothetical protein
MFGACAGCIPIMLSFREKYRRLDIDNATDETEPPTTANESPKSTNGIKTPLGSSLSVFQDDDMIDRINGRESQL